MKFSNYLSAIYILLTIPFSLFADNNPPLQGKTWLQELPHNLYEQPFLKSPEYQKLTVQQKKDYKASYFQNKKLSILTNKAIITASGMGVITCAIPVILICANKFINKISEDDPPLQVIIKMMSTVLAATLTPIYLGGLKLAWDSVANRLWDRIDDPVQFLEARYIQEKERLPSGLCLLIEQQFNISRTDPSRLSGAIDFTETALNLPQKNLKIQFINKKVNEIFIGYNATLQAQVKAFCLRQAMMQPATQDQTKPNSFRQGKRVAAYFQGLPGTGKTRFAELTATALNLPFARISLEGATISDLVGRSLNSGSPTAGLILQALTSAQINGERAKNLVLFIDEADRVINNSKSEILPFLLKMLDPESKSFFNPYLNTEIDISNLTIILAGNYEIQDEALRKRLQIIQFKGFTQEFKKNIIWRSTLPKMCQSYSLNGKFGLTLDDFTAEDRKIINELIEIDCDPGFRTIESVLMDYFDYIMTRKYFDKNVIFPPVIDKIQQSNLEYHQKTITAAAV